MSDKSRYSSIKTPSQVANRGSQAAPKIFSLNLSGMLNGVNKSNNVNLNIQPEMPKSINESSKFELILSL